MRVTILKNYGEYSLALFTVFTSTKTCSLSQIHRQFLHSTECWTIFQPGSWTQLQLFGGKHLPQWRRWAVTTESTKFPKNRGDLDAVPKYLINSAASRPIASGKRSFTRALQREVLETLQVASFALHLCTFKRIHLRIFAFFRIICGFFGRHCLTLSKACVRMFGSISSRTESPWVYAQNGIS